MSEPLPGGPSLPLHPLSGCRLTYPEHPDKLHQALLTSEFHKEEPHLLTEISTTQWNRLWRLSECGLQPGQQPAVWRKYISDKSDPQFTRPQTRTKAVATSMGCCGCQTKWHLQMHLREAQLSVWHWRWTWQNHEELNQTWLCFPLAVYCRCDALSLGCSSVKQE